MPDDPACAGVKGGTVTERWTRVVIAIMVMEWNRDVGRLDRLLGFDLRREFVSRRSGVFPTTMRRVL